MIRAQGGGAEIQLAQRPGQEPPVLAVHGLTANCRGWDTVAGAVSPGRRLLAMDRLGRVLSDFQACVERSKQAPFLRPWSQAMGNYHRCECEEAGGGVRSRIRPENITEERSNLPAAGAARYRQDVRCPVLVPRAAQGMPAGATQRLRRGLPTARVVDLPGINRFCVLLQPSPERGRALGGLGS